MALTVVATGKRDFGQSKSCCRCKVLELQTLDFLNEDYVFGDEYSDSNAGKVNDFRKAR